MFKRLIAGTLSAIICTTAVLPNHLSNYVGREAKAATKEASNISGDYDIRSTNSLGTFFKHAAAEEEVQNPLAENACNSQFQITSLEFDIETGTVRIASTQQTEAKIVVSFINDETSENVLSVETTVSEGELVNSELKADASKLPQYYLVKAQLFDTLNRPVGKPYTLSRYTKEYQEILATDINDFDQEQVVNLDEDETTNFLVLNEDTVIAESSEEQNTLVSADYENNVFVFDNADESVASLEKGEYLYIQPDEDNIIAVSVEKIEKDGDTVTVSGNDDIEDMFDFIKIESDGNMGKAQIDTSAADEGVSFPNVDENGDVIVDDDGTFDFEYVAPQHNTKFEYSVKNTFSLEEPLALKDEDSSTPEKEEGIKDENKLTGSVTLSVNFNFFKKFGKTKIELSVKVTPEIKVTYGLSGYVPYILTSSKAQSIGLEIAKIVIPTSIPGTLIDISPRIFLEFSGKFTFSVKWDNVRGFKYEDGEVEPIAELFDEKNIDVSMKLTGEIYFGLELKLSLAIASENIASVGFDIKAGFKIKAEADIGEMMVQYDKNEKDPPDNVIINKNETASYYHACKFCIQAKTDFEIKVNLEIIICKKKKSWNLFDLSINLPFFNAYFSSEKGFGWGDCYYNRFRTTFSVISSKDKGCIPGAVVKLDGTEQAVDGSGNAVFYCLPGTYSYSVTYNGSSLESGNLKIDNCHTEKTIEADVTLDPEGNPDGGYKPGRSHTVTGTAVTQLVTTKQPFVTQTLPAPSFTKDEIISETGSLGEHISYMLYPDGYLYVCGYGDMYDFGSSPFRDPSIIKYAVIENAGDEKSGGVITSIGNNVFINCSNMESINLPQTIKRIGKNAFGNCSSFSTVSYDEYDYENEKIIEVKYPEGQLVMPEAVTSVDEYAFANCASITDIVIPATISELSSYVFSGTGISELTVPDTITKIKDYVFSDCTSLKKIVISEGTESIGYHIFSGCSAIEDITVPYIGHSLAEANEEGSSQQFSDFFLNGNDKDYYSIHNSVGNRRFIPKSLKSITVTGGSRIPNYAFYRMPGVKNITVPGTIKSFGVYSYADCGSLENANIPEGVISIGNYAFSNCSSSALKTLKLPSTLTSIGSYVFTECRGLTNITIPKSVKTIGEYTFNNCSALKTVVIYGGADGIGGYIFSGCNS
ncbi:leucine-rich repeat domain-containing protein, partial [Ruminococcus flavefaciens]|uniref:leucine-rich repeat domain-containing protein n=1 Tax=Ruminococcus flavefaciens TaxID=1265 RepID=UPI00056C5A53